jgi:hypothetical protein
MSDNLKNKLSKLEAKIQPQTDKEAEEQKQRSEAIECLLKELSELSRLEELEDKSLSPQERCDKEMAEIEELLRSEEFAELINKHAAAAGLQ